MKRRMKMMIFFLMLILCCVSGTRSVEAKSSKNKAGKKTYRIASKSNTKKNKKNNKSKKNNKTNTGKRASKKSSKLEIHFIDVGEGDAILLTFGNEAMMFDYGTAATAHQTYDYVRSQGVSKLKYAVCTHPHPDHMGGMNYFLKRLQVKKALLTPLSNDHPYCTKPLATIENKGIPTDFPKPGKTYKLGKAKIKFLAPLSSDYERVNNYSLVAKVTYGKTSFLLAGDAEKESEEEMIARYGKKLKSDVLKIGHHGNNKATTEEFIKAVSPKQAIISSEQIVSGNPSPYVLSRLQSFGVQIKRTDESSTQVAISNGKKIHWK